MQGIGAGIQRTLVMGAVALGWMALVPAAADAGVGASAVPNFPTAVTVGNTGVPASIELRNTNADANAAESNTVCNFGDPGPCPAGDPGITLIPACNKLGAFSSCTGAEPGVIRVADTATGEAGSACAGMVFNVALADPATGQVRFTPQNGAHVTLVGSGAVCRIGFTFSVLRVPTTDQNPAAEGIQTVQVTDNTQFSGFLTASARGSSVGLRVERASPAIATTASPQVGVGGQVTDAAVVSGLVSPVAGATVDFRLYGPDDADCSRTPVFESLGIPLGADGRAVSAPFTPTKPGVYRWRASYSGDANNNPVAGACNDAGEAVTVVGPPRITVNTPGKPGPCLVTRFTLGVDVKTAGLTGVRVTLDGKTIKRTQRARFKVRIRAVRLSPGRHVIKVTATGAGGRRTRTAEFRRCGRTSLPRFVG